MADTRPAEIEDKQKHNTPRKLVEERIKGVVKWFNVKASYGFIHRSDTDTDVFVHQSAIVRHDPSMSVRSLQEGEEVEFYVVDGDKGDEASEVTGPNGAPVKGSTFARRRPRAPRMFNSRGRGRGFSADFRPYFPRGRGGRGRGGPSEMYVGGGGGGVGHEFMDRGGRGRPFRGRRPRAFGFGGRFNPRGGRGRPNKSMHMGDEDSLPNEASGDARA